MVSLFYIIPIEFIYYMPMGILLFLRDATDGPGRKPGAASLTENHAQEGVL
jgi:hypothetical protein